MQALWVHARDIVDLADASALIAKCYEIGFTDIYYQVLDDDGYAHYQSAGGYFDVCEDIGEFDPLAYLAANFVGHVHAWLCVGTDLLYYNAAWNCKTTQGIDSGYPDWVDFTVSAVRAFTATWCASIVSNYPTVGIHLDYIRWHTDFGDDDLEFATATPITQTVQAVAAAIPASTILSCAVIYDPTGELEGNKQNWGAWFDIVDFFALMLYPSDLSDMQTQLAYSSAYHKDKLAPGLSGLYFTYSPYTEHEMADADLIECMVWARANWYQHFAWFDYTKITAHQFDVIKQQLATLAGS